VRRPWRRELRVVTPDGYVWFVRRRRARRRPFWSRRDRYPERYHDEDELPDEELPVPGVLDLFTYAENDLGDRGFDRAYDDWLAAEVSVVAIFILLFVVSVLGALTVFFVLPWLVPLVVAHARPLLAVAAALVVLAALNQVQRPWYVELRRQGLAGAPRRVWRVRGWRRSGRLMGELIAAVREGRVDRRGAVILPTDERR
jgi:heme A synthase